MSGIIIGKSIKAVTIDPRQTSAMYGIENSNEVKIGGSKFLLTTIHNCDSERLKYIISEDEFLRTLLVIVKIDADLTNAELIDLMRLIRNTIVTSSNEIVFCEDDGDSLCLYNTKVD